MRTSLFKTLAEALCWSLRKVKTAFNVFLNISTMEKNLSIFYYLVLLTRDNLRLSIGWTGFRTQSNDAVASLLTIYQLIDIRNSGDILLKFKTKYSYKTFHRKIRRLMSRKCLNFAYAKYRLQWESSDQFFVLPRFVRRLASSIRVMTDFIEPKIV